MVIGDIAFIYSYMYLITSKLDIPIISAVDNI